jgi:hypothetical protein
LKNWEWPGNDVHVHVKAHCCSRLVWLLSIILHNTSGRFDPWIFISWLMHVEINCYCLAWTSSARIEHRCFIWPSRRENCHWKL